MADYRLETDGDGLEQKYWPLFIEKEFPSYEVFWQKFVVPITNRPKNIHTKPDHELEKIGKTPNDACIAQLHYTILRHLSRIYEILNIAEDSVGLDNLIEAMARICGALDVAHELLERFGKPDEYEPWLETGKRKGPKGGREARLKWREENSHQLEHISNYRNNLLHGRLKPSVQENGIDYFPKFGEENNYCDWRRITDPDTDDKPSKEDFTSAKDLIEDAWNETLTYLEYTWKDILLRNIHPSPPPASTVVAPLPGYPTGENLGTQPTNSSESTIIEGSNTGGERIFSGSGTSLKVPEED